MNIIAPITLLMACVLVIPVAYSEDNSSAVKLGNTQSPASDSNELKLKLDAQMKINTQLRKRLDELEKKLAGSGVAQNKILDENAKTPESYDISTAEMTAIEQTLLSKGLALLPKKSFRITPKVAWQHFGTGGSREDSYIESIALDAGLPWDMMGTVQVPYIQRDFWDGTNKGWGDTSFFLTKQLAAETDTHPSFVAQAGYQLNNGKDAFAQIPIGSGFRTYTGTVSVVKHSSPVAVYGVFSLSHFLDNDVVTSNFNGNIHTGNTYALSTGVSMSVTPAISLRAEAAFRLRGKIRQDSKSGTSTEVTQSAIGDLTFGSGFVLSRNLYLDVSVAAGITKDANSFVLSVALPYRF